MSNSVREPQCQDEVKHKLNDATGVVIARHLMCDEDVVGNTRYPVCLDVRLSDDTIKYATPIENWEVVRTEEDRL